MIDKDRQGDWIATFTGAPFFPLDPRPEDINVVDIAHALSHACRFAGHCTSFYAVAQHCVLVSLMCDPGDALWGLIHDASEAYICDVPRPLKKMELFAPYRDVEKKIMDVICDVFGLPHEEPASVKLADARMLATEARDLTITSGVGWALSQKPYDFHIKPWTPEYARVKFFSRLHELTTGAKK